MQSVLQRNAKQQSRIAQRRERQQWIASERASRRVPVIADTFAPANESSEQAATARIADSISQVIGRLLSGAVDEPACHDFVGTIDLDAALAWPA